MEVGQEVHRSVMEILFNSFYWQEVFWYENNHILSQKTVSHISENLAAIFRPYRHITYTNVSDMEA